MVGSRSKQYTELGRVLVNFGQLEVHVNQFIGWLISDDVGTGQVITSKIFSFRTRVEIFFALYKKSAAEFAWFKPLFSEEDKVKRNDMLARAYQLYKRALTLNSQRNKLVHSTWVQEERHLEEFGEEAPMTGIKPGLELDAQIEPGKTGLIYEINSFTPKELSDLARKLEILKEDFIELQRDTHETLEDGLKQSKLWQSILDMEGQTLRTLDQNKPFDVKAVSYNKLIVVPHASNKPRPIKRVVLEESFSHLLREGSIARTEIRDLYSQWHPAYVASILANLPNVRVELKPIKLFLITN